MSTAYIVLYNKDSLVHLPNVLYSFDKLYTNGDLLLSIFNHKFYTHEDLVIYDSLLKPYENYHRINYIDYTENFKPILESYLHKYDKFLVWNSSLLMTNSIKPNLSDSNIAAKNNPNSGILILDRSQVIELIRNSFSIEYLFDQCNNIKSNRITEYLIDQTKLINNKETDIFYENEHCLFCVLDNKKMLKKSVAYMNKNNNKIFNVNNNIFGTIVRYDDLNLVVEWKINDESQIYTYTKHNLVFI